MTLNDVPNPGQNLQQTQSPIKTNFESIDTAFAADHVPYVTTGAGWHNKVTFPVQGMVPTFASGQDGLYNFANTTTGSNELYANIQKAGGGTANIPFTASIVSQNSGITLGSTGWTYLPSGILMRWDYYNYTVMTGTVVYTYPTGANFPPPFNNLFSVQLTPICNTAGDIDFAVRLITLMSSTQFSMYFSKRTTTGAFTGSNTAVWILSIGN